MRCSSARAIACCCWCARLPRRARDRLPGAAKDLRAEDRETFDALSSAWPGVPERMRADGSVETPLDLAATRAALKAARADGIDAVAIVFMHAYAFPNHEREAACLAQDVGFTQISVSHEGEPAREIRRTRRHHRGRRLSLAAAPPLRRSRVCRPCSKLPISLVGEQAPPKAGPRGEPRTPSELPAPSLPSATGGGGKRQRLAQTPVHAVLWAG